MQVTSVGHAGFHIQTAAGSILCDPWVNPAYFASWFPFPDNTELDWDALGDCDYLYVSPPAQRPFRPANLRENVNKDATVLLPDYPVPGSAPGARGARLPQVRRDRGLGQAPRSPDDKGSLDIMIVALRAPADGPIGDSGIVVSDGETTVFNMNDARPVDMDVIAEQFGHIDIHLLQYSGAIWYPMVYDIPKRTKANFGKQKRQRGMDRGALLHRAGRRHLGGAVGRSAGVPRRRTALPQRRSRRRGQHLPRPERVPRPDGRITRRTTAAC